MARVGYFGKVLWMLMMEGWMKRWKEGSRGSKKDDHVLGAMLSLPYILFNLILKQLFRVNIIPIFTIKETGTFKCTSLYQATQLSSGQARI